MELASTAYRVAEHTPAEVNQRIQRTIEANVAYYRQHVELIDTRLAELDREWDVERALEAHSATVSLAGTVLAATVNRKWLILPLLITAFLFQHAIQGWSPQVAVLRRLGFRTPIEIEQERRQLLGVLEDTEALGHG